MTQFLQKFFSFSIITLLCASSISAQEADIQRCNTDAYMQTLLQNKTYKKAYEKRQAMVAAKSKNSNEKAICANPVNLPMAIHFQGVDASAANQACLEQLAISQIQVLNDDYQGTNADISTWIDVAAASFPNIDYSEACLEFCLATTNHPANSGLSDGDYAITYNAFSGDFSSDWSGYLNIFVQSGTGVLGYSPLGGSGDGDGVVVEAFAFGTRGFNCADAGPDNSTWAYDLGRTLTHEVGHYLNLNHIWGGGCNSDDGVSDTPDSSGPYYGCPSIGETSCNSTDMHMNYMDYTNDACMYMFSAGQATRSENYVNNYLAGQLKNNVCGPAAEPTCDDGIMNGDETGIDCGGSCPTVCPTCDDGIMNGDETDVDCGGSCAACPCSNNTVYVNISFDQYGSETAWDISANDGTVVANGNGYSNGDVSVSEMVCLDDACYTFTIYDQFGDGICCGYGNGSYTLVDGDGNTLVSGAEFTQSETTGFCVGAVIPTCDDGVMNGDETGVDCGGSCPNACVTCNDGIMNGNETGVDCGGDCAACATCDDGIMNGNETGIDCGGDCAACATCDDGIMNGDETGVDCGGSCAACVCTNETVYVEINLDNYPGETSWEIVSLDGTIMASGGNYTITEFVSEMVCLDEACYSFNIYDEYGDGICCAEGNGDYAIVDANGNVLASGGEFGQFDVQGFCLGNVTPTCDDGVMNGDETGIDCGGSCPTVCPTCDDGIMNGTETDVDCGGTCQACPTCNDGIMNGDETGVDCGGTTCAACPTCDDGNLNGSETGIDCGGPDCAACECSENSLTLTIVLDQYGSETGWTFAYENGNAFVGYGNYENGTTGATYTYDICVADGCYQFIIADAFGDGMCCQYGEGSYTLTDANGNVLAAGSEFGASETTTFCVPVVVPTCDDGIMNGDETDIDCGGTNCPACPTCDDGIMNGNETGIDCGGDCEPCIAQCGMATGLIETNPTATGITLQWDAQTAATSYQLAGRKAGGTWKTFPETTNNFRTFNNGIQPNTTYQWTVRVKCDGAWTDWVIPVAEFTTAAARLGENQATFDAFDNAESFLTSTIYPNPAKDEITVETMSTTEDQIQIRLLDLAGKLLIEKTIDAGALQNRTILDISGLQNGYYLIEVNNGLENSISKLSVIR